MNISLRSNGIETNPDLTCKSNTYVTNFRAMKTLRACEDKETVNEIWYIYRLAT